MTKTVYPHSFPVLSLLSTGIHKKSYVLWGGDTLLSKKRRLGLAFDPLVRVNSWLRGISRVSLFLFFFPGILKGKESSFFLSSLLLGCSLDGDFVLSIEN